MTEQREATIQYSIMRLLNVHPKVAWAERMNSGVAKLKGFRVKFGFVGCADIIGQLRDGRLLAIECKNEKGELTEQQEKFLQKVTKNHGVAGVCRSVQDADDLLRLNDRREDAK